MHSFVRRIEPVVETIIHRLYIVAQNQISLIPKVYTSVHYNSKMPSLPPESISILNIILLIQSSEIRIPRQEDFTGISLLHRVYP